MNQVSDQKNPAPRDGETQPEGSQRHDAENALLGGEQRYERLISTIPCALYDYVLWPDGRNQFFYISPQCRDIFECDAEQVVKDASLLWGLVHPGDLARLKSEDWAANRTGKLFHSEVRIVLPSGGLKWIQLTSRAGTLHVDGGQMWSGVILDITERKRVEEERNRLVVELQTALAEVKILRGFLPICASCKKIRDDKGYWNQIEAYLCEHTEATFSHGICPDCAAEQYAELRRLTARSNPCAPSGEPGTSA